VAATALDAAAPLNGDSDCITTTLTHDASTQALSPIDETPALHDGNGSSQLRDRLWVVANRVLPLSSGVVNRP